MSILADGRKADICSSKYFTFSISIQNVVLTEINRVEDITQHDTTVQHLQYRDVQDDSEELKTSIKCTEE
jgi:hypothetical protein